MSIRRLLAKDPDASEFTVQRVDLEDMLAEVAEYEDQVDDLERELRRYERLEADATNEARGHLNDLLAHALKSVDVNNMDDPLHDVISEAQRALGCLNDR